MENINKGTNTGEWVRDQLAGLAPAETWRPDVDAGFAHLHRYEHMAKRRLHLQRVAVLLLLVACAVVLAVPTTRGIARQLLDRFYMRNPEAVRSLVPRTGKSALKVEILRAPVMGPPLLSVADANREAGFNPWLPPMLAEQVISGLAVVSVIGPVDARIRINVADLRTALRNRGIEGVAVPQNWDGVEIGYHGSPSIVVAFLDGDFSQSLSPEMTTPPGFLIIDFTEIAIRAAGVGPTEAHNSRDMFVESGGVFAIVPSDARSNFREMSLKSGRGLLFGNDTDQDERQKCSLCAGPHERVLTWSASNRLFQLRSQTMTADRMVEFANSVN
jgi:hypothetical protein